MLKPEGEVIFVPSVCSSGI